MKEFITSCIAFAKEQAKITPPVYRHGLSITVKPHNPVGTEVASQSDIQTKGCDIFDITTMPNEFEKLFSHEWLNGDDQISLQTITQSNNITGIRLSQDAAITINKGIQTIAIIATNNTESTLNINSNSNTQLRIHMFVEKNAKVTINHFQQGECIVIKKAQVDDDARLYFNDVLTTNSYARLYEDIQLIGKNSTGKQKVISLTYKDAIADIYTKSDHISEYSYSDIITRSVICDSSKTLSRGLVKIQSEAANSEGYEKQDALMLSNECEADAIPNLEIHNHNVKCSHGSTVGKMNKDHIFYLMSRGLSESNAKKEIIKAYFEPILDKLHNEQIQEHVHKTLEENV